MKTKIVFLIVVIVLMITVFNTTKTYAGIIDDALSGGKSFIDSGSSSDISSTNLQKTSKSINKALLFISFVVVAIVGISLGIKFMMAGVEEKADVKKSLVTFVIGCVVAYGAYGIWAAVLRFLNDL